MKGDPSNFLTRGRSAASIGDAVGLSETGNQSLQYVEIWRPSRLGAAKGDQAWVARQSGQAILRSLQPCQVTLQEGDTSFSIQLLPLRLPRKRSLPHQVRRLGYITLCRQHLSFVPNQKADISRRETGPVEGTILGQNIVGMVRASQAGIQRPPAIDALIELDERHFKHDVRARLAVISAGLGARRHPNAQTGREKYADQVCLPATVADPLPTTER